MQRDEFIKMISRKLKLIRTEYGITQEVMSEMLGISKKTLIETEKGRRDLSWTEVIAVVTVFEKSEVLQDVIGTMVVTVALVELCDLRHFFIGEGKIKDIQIVLDMIHVLAFENRTIKYPPTMGGKVWWRVIDEKNGIRLQQNYVTGHYRLLDKNDCRLISSFDRNEIEDYRDSLGRN